MWSKETKEIRQALKDRIKAVYDSRNDWEHDRSTIEQRATMIFHMNEVMLYFNNEEIYLGDWIISYPDENPFDEMVCDCDDDDKCCHVVCLFFELLIPLLLYVRAGESAAARAAACAPCVAAKVRYLFIVNKQLASFFPHFMFFKCAVGLFLKKYY